MSAVSVWPPYDPAPQNCVRSTASGRPLSDRHLHGRRGGLEPRQRVDVQREARSCGNRTRLGDAGSDSREERHGDWRLAVVRIRDQQVFVEEVSRRAFRQEVGQRAGAASTVSTKEVEVVVTPSLTVTVIVV